MQSQHCVCTFNLMRMHAYPHDLGSTSNGHNSLNINPNHAKFMFKLKHMMSSLGYLFPHTRPNPAKLFRVGLIQRYIFQYLNWLNQCFSFFNVVRVFFGQCLGPSRSKVPRPFSCCFKGLDLVHRS